MYRPNDIKTAFSGIVGWRQDSGNNIPASLLPSSSGLFFQDFHPLLTIDNLLAISPPNEPFGTWLETKTMSTILKLIGTIIDKEVGHNNAKILLEKKFLFDQSGRLSDTIPNADNLVGFEIVPLRSNGVTTKIERIGLQFAGTGDVVMHLFHSSSPDAVRTFSFTRTRNGGLEWFTPSDELYLPYASSDNDAGGSWYLVYDQRQSVASGEAVNKNRDWSQAPCSSCSRYDTYSYNIWSKYLEIHPFKYLGEFDGGLWSIDKNLYTYTHNYGINLEISIKCDLTEIMIGERDSFARLIGLQMACDMIREFAYNANFRVNRMQQNFNKGELLYELDGDSTSNKKSGLVHQLNSAIDALSVDLSKMSRVCFPCNKKGVRFRTV